MLDADLIADLQTALRRHRECVLADPRIGPLPDHLIVELNRRAHALRQAPVPQLDDLDRLPARVQPFARLVALVLEHGRCDCAELWGSAQSLCNSRGKLARHLESRGQVNLAAAVRRVEFRRNGLAVLRER